MTDEPKKTRVVFCTPTIKRPYRQFLDALEAEVPLLDAAGIEHYAVNHVGSAYISHARAEMLRKAMDVLPDVVVFIDHDLSWKPGELLRLIQTPGDVVAGTYRYKQAKEEYMGTWFTDAEGVPTTREDGCIKANWVPAGFLKITDGCVQEMMRSYPELNYGPLYHPSHDLFNHGVHKAVWFGEDYAFSRRWNDRGGEIWIVPDLDLTHHDDAGNDFPGNFHTYLRRRPGGDLAETT